MKNRIMLLVLICVIGIILCFSDDIVFANEMYGSNDIVLEDVASNTDAEIIDIKDQNEDGSYKEDPEEKVFYETDETGEGYDLNEELNYSCLSIDEPAVQVITEYNGVDYSKVYDYTYYLEHNPDVERAYKGDPEKTLTHFVNYGMKERRVSIESFDVNSYCKSYKDLRSAFINDSSRYYMHYLQYGYNEGRKPVGEKEFQGTVTSMRGQDYSDVYDYEYYINRYPDIKKYVSNKMAPDASALEHFLNCGMKENRQASEDFDVISYSNEYADLRKAYGQDSKKYYQHYIDYGKKEKRKATGVKEVKDPVTTLKGTDYSRVYDYNYYLQKYPDLKRTLGKQIAPDVAALNHFISYGMKEKRQASVKFDVMSYYRSYQDLRVAFHNDFPKYYEHYLKNGYRENRKTTGETKLQNPVTKYGGVDFKSIYDYKFYTGKYADILRAYGEDDIETLHHFVKYGINEGRAGKASYSAAEYNRLKAEAKEIIIRMKSTFKILTYNVNHFNKDSDKYISQEKISNFIQMLKDIDADFVSIQEDGFVDGKSLSQYDILFSSLYPYRYGEGGTTIYSKVRAEYAGVLSYSNGRALRYSTFEINNKSLLFISTHPVSGLSENSVRNRNVQYNELFQWISGKIMLKDYLSDTMIKVPENNYCIIGMDSNANTSIDKNNMIRVTKQYSYNMANGGSFGWIETRRNDKGTKRYAIDNIICSDNICIDAVKSYSNLYYKLYSDHYPFTASVTINSAN